MTDSDRTYDLDDPITGPDGQPLGTVRDLARAAMWADPEPGQTETRDELRLHLLSEHGLKTALGMTDADTDTAHQQRHTLAGHVGHPDHRTTWNEDRIVGLLLTCHSDVTLTSRWNAHYTRVERAGGGPPPPPAVPAADPEIYEADLDEMAKMGLAVLDDVRDRLVAHFSGWDDRAALAAADIVDEYAREIVDEHTDDVEETDGHG